jgi:8-oxo-dGTP diphosphatase
MPIGRFLAGVAALIWDPPGNRYLLLRRSPTRDFQRGDWECVTGRVDQGESYTQALHREVMEEIGARVQIEFVLSLTHFYRGEQVPENELLGALFGCTLLEDQQAAMLGDEHSEMQWVTFDQAQAMLPSGHWLLTALRRAERLRNLLPEELRLSFRQEGLEL